MPLLPGTITRSTPTPTMMRTSPGTDRVINKNNVFDLIENGVPYEARTRKLTANGRVPVSRSGSSVSNRFQPSPIPVRPLIPVVKDETKEEKAAEKKRREDLISHRIDTVGKILFPTCYLIFNIFYWAKYLGATEPPEHISNNVEGV